MPPWGGGDTVRPFTGPKAGFLPFQMHWILFNVFLYRYVVTRGCEHDPTLPPSLKGILLLALDRPRPESLAPALGLVPRGLSKGSG